MKATSNLTTKLVQAHVAWTRTTPARSLVPVTAIITVLAALLIPTSAFAYPGEDKILSSKALEKYNSGDYKDAEDLYEQAASKDTNAAAARFNLGTAQYKNGKPDDAQKDFQSVFDENNNPLNGAAEFNAGVIDHKSAEKAIEELKKSAQAPGNAVPGAPQAQPSAAGEAPLDKAIKPLEKALEHYRGAILKLPDDPEAKLNYEIAKRQLDELRQQQQQQQQQNKQNQDQKKDDEKKDQNQNDQNKDQKQDQKNDQDKKSGQNKKDEKKPDQKNDSGSDNQNKKDDKSDQKDKDQKDNKQSPEATPTPTPKPDDSQEKKDQKDQGKNDDKQDQKDQQPQESDSDAKPGEMSKNDVDRLLNSLGQEDPKALQRLLKVKPQDHPDLDKDW